MFQRLVVEDDADLNRSVCTFLNSGGYRATGCQNTHDACDTVNTGSLSMDADQHTTMLAGEEIKAVHGLGYKAVIK